MDMAAQTEQLARRRSRASDANFHKLPAELKLATVGFLSDEDILNFRRANREFNHLSFDIFGKRFFSSRAVALHLADLQCFVNIAEALGKYVKTLEVIPQTWTKSHLQYIDEEIDYWKSDRLSPYLDDDESQQQYAEESFVRFRQRIVDLIHSDKNLRSRCGLACSLLTRAVSRLTNLQAVSFTPSSKQIRKLWEGSKVAQLDSDYAEDVSLDFLDGWDPHFHCPDFETFMTAMIASGAAPSNLAFEDDFLIGESTPSEDGPEALDLHNFLRNLKELELTLVVDENSDVGYMPWFLAAVPKSLERLSIRGYYRYLEGVVLLEHPDQSNAIFQRIFAEWRFHSLRHLEVEFPPSVFSDLVQLVRDNITSLAFVELVCEAGLDQNLANTTKWSELLKLFLEAPVLQGLILEPNSGTYRSGDSFGTTRYIDGKTPYFSSPKSPGRVKLLQKLEEWEKYERDAGL